MELYKKHRPKKFDDVVGCGSTVAALKAMVDAEDVPRVILFHGPKGCGKTTLGRILANELQCHELDFREINCASNTGVDAVRAIETGLVYNPSAGPCRVYILDEVHMLTKAAQSAALKMMEDVPRYAYFLLCTTNPEALLPTLRDRPTPMPVRLMSSDDLKVLTIRVCKKEKVPAPSRDIQDELILQANGSARMLLVLLDKIYRLPEDDQLAAIEEAKSEVSQSIDICRALIKGGGMKGWKTIAPMLQNLKSEPEEVRWAILGYARAVLLKEASHRAYVVIDCFENNFYDSKQAGLAKACYDVMFDKGGS